MPDKHPYSLSEWRLVKSGFADGPTNMAIDEAILHSVAAQESPPTVRFYGWKPACLSLGFRQPWDIVDFDYCRSAGWDVVRRPTGGRAILHIDELTYSVIAPVSEPRVHGSVLVSYQRLSEALLNGLVLLGVSPSRPQVQRSGWKSTGPACFDLPSDYEITVGGRKLVGSAQVRKKEVVLQHGTIPLSGDLTRIVYCLRLHDDGERFRLASELRNSATTLEQSTRRSVDFEAVTKKMTRGFEESLNLVLRKGYLNLLEKELSDRLLEEKYANDSWNRRLQQQAGRLQAD